jgi:hypothetical protein
VTARDHPDVLSVCRWLPQPFAFGAFSGQHDLVHCQERQALVNLWFAATPVHEGDYVGPPRGGLVPGSEPDYDVAMPAGGFLQVRGGALVGWRPEPGDAPLIRADGSDFLPESYGPAAPYLVEQYRAMTADDRLNALAAVRRRRLSMAGPAQVDQDDIRPSPQRDAESQAIADWVEVAKDPQLCDCAADRDGHASGARRRSVPGSLLAQGGAVATLVGGGSAADACEVVWRLTAQVSDPDRSGLAQAAETAARRQAEKLSGWPDAPLTEDAVAVVAAQALRWHGAEIAKDLPFWTLGWIFMAGSVLDGLLDGDTRQRRELRAMVLDRADRMRMRRVARSWAVAQSVERDLEQLTTANPTGTDVLDLRTASVESQSPAADLDGYDRTVESVIGELASQ